MSPYLYLIYSSTTESSEEVNTIESLPMRSEPQIVQKPIYSLTTEFQFETTMSEKSSKIESLPIRSEPQYSSTTEFQLETRLSEESGKVESLPVRSEPQIADKPRMSGVGTPKLSTLCHISLIIFYSLYLI